VGADLQVWVHGEGGAETAGHVVVVVEERIVEGEEQDCVLR
jgi:hypothetical protein